MIATSMDCLLPNLSIASLSFWLQVCNDLINASLSHDWKAAYEQVIPAPTGFYPLLDSVFSLPEQSHRPPETLCHGCCNRSLKIKMLQWWLTWHTSLLSSFRSVMPNSVKLFHPSLTALESFCTHEMLWLEMWTRDSQSMLSGWLAIGYSEWHEHTRLRPLVACFAAEEDAISSEERMLCWSSRR